MSYYVGLDVSVKLTAVCIIDDTGKVATERVVSSDPEDIARCIAGVSGEIARVGLEAGPLAPSPSRLSAIKTISRLIGASASSAHGRRPTPPPMKARGCARACWTRQTRRRPLVGHSLSLRRQ